MIWVRPILPPRPHATHRPLKHGRLPWHANVTTTPRPFAPMSKRRKGFPSETHVKRGRRFIKGGEIELTEKLGRNDPCPCGSGRRFQEVLPHVRPL